MSDRYARYQRLQFDWPAPRVLRVRMNNPGKLNAADQTMHGELGDDLARRGRRSGRLGGAVDRQPAMRSPPAATWR